jgi:hypothetical protein
VGSVNLVEFLHARLDDEERMAREATPGPWEVDNPNSGSGYPPFWNIVNDAFVNPPADDDEPWLAVELHTGVKADADHIAYWDPARVLADVAAKRTLIEAIVDHNTARGLPIDPPALRILAAPYASHPDYQQEWTP